MFADVVLPQRRYRIFTYRVPSHLQDRLHIGSRVLVPLGRHLVYGFVFSVRDHAPDVASGEPLHASRIRAIHSLVEAPLDAPLEAEQLALATRMAEYYLAPPASVLRLLLPPAPAPRVIVRYVLTDAGKQAIHTGKPIPEPTRQILLKLLRAPRGLTDTTLAKAYPEATRTLARLVRKGWLSVVESASGQGRRAAKPSREQGMTSSPVVNGAPEGEPPSDSATPVTDVLRDGQSLRRSASPEVARPTWWSEFQESLAQHRYQACLLHASPETRARLLMEAVEASLRCHRSALILAPEIDQADALFHRLRARFGARATVFHGELPLTTRSIRWRAIREGTMPVVVGTHAALFLPLPALGLIWVEREEDTSFKAEHSPYYHARTVAEMRADLEKAALILSTSHPSLETAYRFSVQSDRAWIEPTPSPPTRHVRIVSLQDIPYDQVLSDEMMQGIAQALEARGRVILFLNRKGFSRALVCRDCGHVPRCRSCHIALLVYRHPQRLVCPYCRKTIAMPETCPACMSLRWQSSGIGTERVEARVRDAFPSIPVARFDRDSVRTRAQEANICEAFSRGEIRILIGTELLIHTQPLPRASFVGLPYADAGLHLPDFRAAERAYHLLSDVVELAEQDTAESQIVMQTALPTHHVIQAVAQHDPKMFYEHELALRRELRYPPFSQLIQISFTGRDQRAVETAALAYGARLRAHLGQIVGYSTSPSVPTLDPVLGPIAAIRPRRSARYRWVILLKNLDHAFPVHRLVREVERECGSMLTQQRVAYEITVDPVELT